MNDFEKRRAWFEQYVRRLDEGIVQPPVEGRNYSCPCCGYPTLEERSGFEICPICSWEDDGQDDSRAEEVWGGPNSTYSLAEARENFRKHLTMYRPTDVRAFHSDTQPKRMAKKRKLIAEFESARNSATGEQKGSHRR